MAERRARKTGKRKTKQPEAKVEPGGRDESTPPRMVRVTTVGKVIVERNRTIRVYRGDVFVGHMAGVLWRDARDMVEIYDPTTDTDEPYSDLEEVGDR